MRYVLAVMLLAIIGCNESQHGGSSEKVDRILIVKSGHTMTLYANGRMLHTYRVALGRGSGAAKLREGDHNTPEGSYVIDARNPHSHFYRALHLSYPNPADRVHAARLGASPGGDIMIHGVRNGLGWLGSLQHTIDWTDGCIAITDAEMDEVWSRVPIGTAVEIRH